MNQLTVEELINSVNKKSNIIAHEIVEFNMDLAKSAEDLKISKMMFEEYIKILYNTKYWIYIKKSEIWLNKKGFSLCIF